MNNAEGIEKRNYSRIEKPLVVKFNYLGRKGWESLYAACHNISEDGALIKYSAASREVFYN